MFLPIWNNVKHLKREGYVTQLLKINDEIQDNELMLSTSDAISIIETREQVLGKYDRIEIGLDPISLIVKKFKGSSFIDSNNYVNTINDLIELFYYMKNETYDKIGDNELICILYDSYNTECFGAIELLRTKMEEYARNFRIKIANSEFEDKRKDIYEK